MLLGKKRLVFRIYTGIFVAIYTVKKVTSILPHPVSKLIEAEASIVDKLVHSVFTLPAPLVMQFLRQVIMVQGDQGLNARITQGIKQPVVVTQTPSQWCSLVALVVHHLTIREQPSPRYGQVIKMHLKYIQRVLRLGIVCIPLLSNRQKCVGWVPRAKLSFLESFSL